MSAVSTTEAWPARGQPFTVSDLDRLPDDGRRYELLDGVLVVRPRPTTVHQFAATQPKRPFRVAVVPATLLAGLPGRHP
jgi:hypothetical protein